MVSFAQVVTIAELVIIVMNTEENDENRGVSHSFLFRFLETPHNA